MDRVLLKNVGIGIVGLIPLVLIKKAASAFMFRSESKRMLYNDVYVNNVRNGMHPVDADKKAKEVVERRSV